MALNDLNLSEIALLEDSMASLQVIALAIESNLENIQSVLEDRANGILEEPELNLDALTTIDHPSIDKIVSDYTKFVQDNIVAPFEENKARFESLSAETQLNLQNEDPPIFDLTYGPPVSVKGQFILSDDGLYYDSISGGIPEVSGFAAASSTWNLNYAPNLGGKGEVYTQDHLDNFVDTVLNMEYSPEDSIAEKYYETDDVLETFEKNKIMHTTLIHDQIEELVASGYTHDSATVVNYYSNIGALAAVYDDKSNKRKKQLQLVSIFATDRYSFSEDSLDVSSNPKNIGLGAGLLIENIEYANGGEVWSPIERIPLNDFSFLKGKGVDIPIQEQEKLLLFSEDLEDVILPLTPVFVQSPANPISVIDKFSVSPTSPETFPYFEGDSHVSATAGVVQSLVDSVVSDGMVVGYNFLKPDVVEASSLEFNLDNISPDSGGLLDGQLVGSSIDSVFVSGLGIPKLTGTKGSYARLPSNFSPGGDPKGLYTGGLDNLFYSSNYKYNPATNTGGGCTFDFWVHVPSLSFTDEHRYRLIAACENSGGNPNAGSVQGDVQATRTTPLGDHDDSKVHGMIIGFRDKGGDTSPSGIEFGIFPTVSQNNNNGSFGHSIAIAEAREYQDGVLVPDSIRELGAATADTVTSNGISILDASSGFVHVAVVFDYSQDTLTTYFDGEELSASSIRDAFDLQNEKTISIPSFTKTGSEGVMTSSWENTSNDGPKVGNLGLGFTPWILGGGFSDGIEPHGTLSTYAPGFLGYNTNSYYGNPPASQHSPSLGGIYSTPPSSGLDGFLGSFKLYSRALSNSEVKKNFTFQKGFYKNILI